MDAAPRRLSQAEFVAMAACIFATIAFSIDAMLPALPEIGKTLQPDAPNRAALVVLTFVLGMGIGTLFTGPLSDALGRRAVIQGGAVLYMTGALLAWISPSLELLLAARVLQGLGMAGPRVAIMAVVRDLYEGREMARLLSFIMMVFTLVPAVAPTVGAGIIALSDWRAIFVAFVMFSVVSVGWYTVRQPETLPMEHRRPMTRDLLLDGMKAVFSYRSVTIAILVQTFVFSTLFMLISTIQQIMDQTYGRGESFPLWFGLIAILSGGSSMLNAAIVGRFGMRRIIRVALSVQVLVSGTMTLLLWTGYLPTGAGFGLFVAWAVTVFSMIGLTIGNLNSLAMEPLGHVAGLAASIIGSVSTVGAVALSAPVSQLFDGTALPLAAGIFTAIVTAAVMMRFMPD